MDLTVTTGTLTYSLDGQVYGAFQEPRSERVGKISIPFLFSILFRRLTDQGFSLAHNTKLPFYKFLAVNPDRAKRFSGAMQAFGDGPDISPTFLVESFPWESLGDGIVVDLGGSNGSVSVAIAQAYQDLHFVVQDRLEVITTVTDQHMPAHVKGRITFMTHDFFTEQPISADLYLFRYIFHNWPDKYAIEILRQLIPVLKPGARILINDHLLPEPNTASLTTEREAR